jgi:hypothetical protein
MERTVTKVMKLHNSLSFVAKLMKLVHRTDNHTHHRTSVMKYKCQNSMQLGSNMPPSLKPFRVTMKTSASKTAHRHGKGHSKLHTSLFHPVSPTPFMSCCMKCIK